MFDRICEYLRKSLKCIAVLEESNKIEQSELVITPKIDYFEKTFLTLKVFLYINLYTPYHRTWRGGERN